MLLLSSLADDKAYPKRRLVPTVQLMTQEGQLSESTRGAPARWLVLTTRFVVRMPILTIDAVYLCTDSLSQPDF